MIKVRLISYNSQWELNFLIR